MRKSLLTIGLSIFSILGSQQAYAQPTTALDYEPSVHSEEEIKAIYKDLFKKDKLKADDCFKRAYIWSYQMVKKYNARPIKVFFHYTNKFNQELDSQGETGFLARRLNGGSSIIWDFHVAPAVENENGEIMVFDPVVFPKHGEAMTLETWIKKLTSRGEFLLKKRKRKLTEDVQDYTKKIRSLTKKLKTASAEFRADYARRLKEAKKKLKEAQDTIKYIGIKEDGTTDPITCREIKHIEEFDQNQYTEWCHYQKTSMYYYATGELRVLNYGTLGQHKPGQRSTQYEINDLINTTFRYPVNQSNLNTQRYFANGSTIYQQNFYDDGAKYTVHEFSDYYLKMSLGEFKRKHRPELEFFKTYLKSKDKDLEERLEKEKKAEEKRKKEEAKAERRRQKEKAKAEKRKRKEEERRRRRARRN